MLRIGQYPRYPLALGIYIYKLTPGTFDIDLTQGIELTAGINNRIDKEMPLPRYCSYLDHNDNFNTYDFVRSTGLASPQMLDGQQRSLKLGSTGVKYTAFHFNGTDLKILDPIGCAKYDLTYDKCYAAVEEEIKNPPRQEAPASKPEPAPGPQKADPVADQLSKAKESERRLKTEDEIYQDLQNRRADFMGLHNNRGVFGDMDVDRKIAHDIASGVDPLEAYQRQRDLDYLSGAKSQRSAFYDDINKEKIRKNLKNGMSLGDAIASAENDEICTEYACDTLGGIIDGIFGLDRLE